MNYLSLVLVAASLFFSSLHGAAFSDIPSSMQPQISLLQRFPDTRLFIDTLQVKEPITLKWLPLGADNSNAFWSIQKNLIALNASRNWEEGEMIYSLLFELHNAASSPQLIHLDMLASKKQISKQDYVLAVEQIEYNNVLSVSNLLEKGVRLGYFPRSTYIPQYPDFKEHLKMQRECGHSAFIAQKYEHLNRLELPSYLK
jgi:hypothetical protein